MSDEPQNDEVPMEEHWRKVEVTIYARTFGNREQVAQFAHEIVENTRRRIGDAVLDARLVIYPPEQSTAIAPRKE